MYILTQSRLVTSLALQSSVIFERRPWNMLDKSGRLCSCRSYQGRRRRASEVQCGVFSANYGHSGKTRLVQAASRMTRSCRGLHSMANDYTRVPQKSYSQCLQLRHLVAAADELFQAGRVLHLAGITKSSTGNKICALVAEAASLQPKSMRRTAKVPSSCSFGPIQVGGLIGET